MTDEANFLLRARREKLAALEACGVSPFAYRFDRTHDAAAAVTPRSDPRSVVPCHAR